MALRRHLFIVLVAVFGSTGASYRTTNFLVEAPTPQIAEQVGKWAEYYRREKALQWIQREMPPWPEPCPLNIKITAGGAGGATQFNFMGGQVWQRMDIEGPLDRLVYSVLPHEVTHTVFAHYFRRPVPRWADEGGAVLSEDDLERSRHDQMVRQILNANHAIPLGQLFSLREYPRDVGALYAEGFSVANFLVASSDRKTFLDFVAHGMQYGWDSAAQTVYRYQNVNQLERAWLDYLIRTKRQPANLVARNPSPAPGDPAKRVVVRLTAPPAQPFEDAAPTVVRGQAPETDSSGWSDAPRRQRPGYLPEMAASRPTPNSGRWNQPGDREPSSLAPGIRLGQPQFEDAPRPPRGNPLPISPAGYPQ